MTPTYPGSQSNLTTDYGPDLPWVTVKLDHGLWPWLTLGRSQTWPRAMTLAYPGSQSNFTTDYDSSLSWVAVKLHYGLWPWLTLGRSQTSLRTMTLTYPGSQSNLTIVPGVKAKVDFRPFAGVTSCPQDITWNKKNFLQKLGKYAYSTFPLFWMFTVIIVG